MSDLKIAEHSATSCNILTVRVGTNCPKGGDSSHGGVTHFELKDDSSTHIEVEKTERGVILRFGGDTECDTLIECLRFAAAELEAQQRVNGR